MSDWNMHLQFYCWLWLCSVCAVSAQTIFIYNFLLCCVSSHFYFYSLSNHLTFVNRLMFSLFFYFFSKFEAFQFNTRKHRKSHPHFGSLLCQTLFDINSNDFRSFKFIMHFSLWFTPLLLCLFVHLVQLLFLLIV